VDDLWTLEEIVQKADHEGGLEGLWWWGGEEIRTGIKEFDDAWLTFGHSLEFVEGFLPSE